MIRLTQVRTFAPGGQGAENGGHIDKTRFQEDARDGTAQRTLQSDFDGGGFEQFTVQPGMAMTVKEMGAVVLRGRRSLPFYSRGS